MGKVECFSKKPNKFYFYKIYRPLVPKCHFSVREIWKRIFSFGTEVSVERHADFSADSGESLP